MTAIATVVDAGLARIVLDNPPVNVLTRAVLRAIREDLRQLTTDASVRALMISATGRHFSGGADVAEHLPPSCEHLIPEFLGTVAELEAFPAPVIAAVRGRCLGGGFELVLAADLIIASDTALFGQPEIHLGVAPPAGAAWLPSRTSYGVAADLVLTGDPITAAEAERAGLVRKVVADDQLDAEAAALAARITRHSGAALRVAKQMLRAGKRERPAAALKEAGDLYVHALMRTADAVEGLQAFLDKRPPVWSHR